ncbi:hypothetical protein [Nostoc sp. ATCC 53789]|uniref:hypothetical protein n=1 Tax=Nostoc sp. ATCC 53789 TaxID=76335 RepID=UPI00132EDB88|nr:hypothetical protein [Nostoc sp. ATCC 53789]QHG18425.1 hypothetical protein GJB62_22255 [Nostoc sp. ATCC 53789]
MRNPRGVGGVGGVGGWGRSLTPHTPHTPLHPPPVSCGLTHWVVKLTVIFYEPNARK